MKRNLTGVVCVLIIFLSVACITSGVRIVDNNFPLDQAWSYSTSGLLISYSVYKDWVIIATSDGLINLDAATGSLLWKNDFLVSENQPSLAISNDRIIAIGHEQIVKVFTIQGNEISTFSLTSDQETGTAQIADLSDRFIFLIRDTNWVLEAYDWETGTFLWSVPISHGGADVYFDTELGHVFVVNSSVVRAYDAVSGEVLWELTGSIRASAYKSNTLFFYVEGDDNQNNQITAFDVRENIEIWSTPVTTDINQISLYQEMVLTSTPTGIFAFDSMQGSLLWQFSPDDEFSTPVIGIDDQLFIRGALSRTIYALSNEAQSIGTLQLGSSVFFVQSQTSYLTGINTVGNLLIFVVNNQLFAYEKK